jgi:hypothetical protein
LSAGNEQTGQKRQEQDISGGTFHESGIIFLPEAHKDEQNLAGWMRNVAILQRDQW